jgi:3-hydroxybutyryl-CoA dehydrogenase
MSDEIKTVAVIGAGVLGRQIAEKTALHNYNVYIYDIGYKGYDKFIKGLERKVNKKQLSIVVTSKESIKDAVKEADLIIEAVPEKLELKIKVFSEIDKSAPAHAIIATNSSSIPVSKIEDAVKRKDKVLNIHFYNLTLSPMADIMRGTQSSEETFEKGKKWIESIEIEPLIVKRECYGFVFNRVWRAVKKECLKIWDGGYADLEDVDKAWKIWTGMGLGPFKLMDAVGLDVVYDIEMSYYKESGNPDDEPPQALKNMVDKGLLGLKSGEGFYKY